ncbi:unnamed protein product [Didymodactylos carnosus]|uniref:Uncharacterized protein n=1 Tax=Didymodactylos carnosus TaxID=1234261 RepID=A0A8S2UCJ2_9BILA|nr:unnamed protein product [Didymodactylos carnosus]CAF4336512.1 unnamed protein product [Didymodactylos carnosus]
MANYQNYNFNNNSNQNNRQNSYSTAHIVSDSLNMVNDFCYDPNTNVYYNMQRNPYQKRIPAPTTTNLQPVNSPARSIRRTLSQDSEDEFRTVIYKKKRNDNQFNYYNQQQHSYPNKYLDIDPSYQSVIPRTRSQRTIINSNLVQLNQQQSEQQHKITAEATRYAQTRYPFAPFIVRFSSPNVKEQKVAEDLCNHLKQSHGMGLEFIGYRRSTAKCSVDASDILLFVKDSVSFGYLYDDENWPQQLCGHTFIRPSKPPIPPQLSLIMKSVGLSIDIIQFTCDLKSTYSDISMVIRLKNQKQNDTKLVKLQFSR